MSSLIIRVEKLGKKYCLRHETEGRYTALRDVLADRASSVFQRNRSRLPTLPSRVSKEDFWALQDVSFEVQEGEIVGVVGRNGAGKSTLLKLLSRITEPTTGRIRIRGRVASLLEVGTGFHPELTGRENIYLNGAILGMSRAEIQRKFDEIVAFAEVERFLDTPVKRYSSGMYVRLAFAVAAHLEPEILVVDEVLAVGDAEFQKKCLGKIKDVANSQHRTILFVSHNMAAVQTLCQRGILLRRGRIQTCGAIDSVLAEYTTHSKDECATELFRPIDFGEGLSLSKFSFDPNPVQSGKELHFELEFHATQPTRLSDLAILVYSPAGVRTAILDLRQSGLPKLAPGEKWRCRGNIESMSLVEGEYRMGLYANAGASNTNFLDLLSVTVSAADAHFDFAPYAAPYRGNVELEFNSKFELLAN